MDMEKCSFVFPGQGSQSVGMGRALWEASPAAKKVFEEVDDVLGFSLSHLMFEGPAEELQDTINAQPAIMAVSIACLRAWEEFLGQSLLPDYAAGHSLGEYTSLVAVDVISFADGIKLVRERGHLMQQASVERPGGMAAILGLEEMALVQICSETGVELANINTKDQIVISGDTIAVARAMDLASVRGAKKVVPLTVSGAFHSELMQLAKPGLQKILESLHFQDSPVPIVANCTATPITSARELKEELVQGLCQCVRWKDSVQHMVDSRVSLILEFGPGQVLSSLTRRIDGGVQAVALSDPNSIRRVGEETVLSKIKKHKKAIALGGAALAVGTFVGIKAGQHIRNRRKRGRES